MSRRTDRSTAGTQDYPYFRTVWNQVVTTMLVASFLPLLLVGGGLYVFTVMVVKEKGLERLKVAALERKISVDRFLENRILDLRQLGGELRSDNLEAIFLNAALTGLNHPTPWFLNLSVVNLHGHSLVTAGSTRENAADVSQRDWFKESLSSGLAITDMSPDGHNDSSFLLAVRVQTPDGLRILYAEMPGRLVAELVVPNPEHRHADAYLINRQGRFQTRPILGGQLLDPSPVKHLDQFDGVRMEETDRDFLVKIWQDRVPWINVIQIPQDDVLGQLKRVYTIGFLVLIILAIPIVGIVLLTGNNLAARLEAKRSSLKVLDHQLRRASYMSSSMALSMSCYAELKDVLTNVDMTARVMLEDPTVSASPDLQDSATDIQSEVDRGQRAVERFLRYIEPLPPLILEVDVHKLLDELLAILDRELRFRNIAVSRQFQAEQPILRSDSAILRQVFQNIVVNALEAMEKDGQLTLTTTADDHWIQVHISDTGPGIPAADLQHVFKPLWTTRPQGIGLGLSICQEILEKIEGRITIDASPGQGALVTVTLPRRLEMHRIQTTTVRS